MGNDMRAILFAAALDIFLVVVQALFPSLTILPLAGSGIAQLGVLLGLALFCSETVRLVRRQDEK